MKQFKKVYIEITNICNLSCNFCPKTNREPMVMQKNAFIHVLDQIKPYTDHIYFHLMGEPLLNPKLDKFLELSYQSGFKVNLTTNGTLIRQHKEILLSSKALRQLNISLSSYEANDSTLSLREYLDNIIEFLLEADDRGDKICSLRLWNLDSEELKGSNKANTDILEILEKGLQLELSLADELLKGNSVKLKNKIYLNMAEKFAWPDINKVTSAGDVFCYGLRDQIGILVDGTVVPCCLDSEGNIPLGNIFDVELKQILASERAAKLYEGFSGRCAVEELCKRCGYALRFSK